MRIVERNRPAYSLMEALCVMGLLVEVICLLALILTEIFDVERVQAEAFQRMAQHQALADEFRGDVARAEKAPAQWRDYQAGPDTLILQMKTGHVVYQWTKGQLLRREFDAAGERPRVIPLDASRVAVEFVLADQGAGVVRLHLQNMRDGQAMPGQGLELAAALGGDRR
jgi:hypothetical protein